MTPETTAGVAAVTFGLSSGPELHTGATTQFGL